MVKQGDLALLEHPVAKELFEVEHSGAAGVCVDRPYTSGPAQLVSLERTRVSNGNLTERSQAEGADTESRGRTHN